jgi:hypothetical protein
MEPGLTRVLDTKPWGPPCPVCGKQALATFAIEGTMTTAPNDDETYAIQIRGGLVGIKIEHDCVPAEHVENVNLINQQFPSEGGPFPEQTEGDPIEPTAPRDMARAVLTALANGEMDPAVVYLPDLILTDIRAVRDALRDLLARARAESQPVPFTPSEG